MGKNM